MVNFASACSAALRLSSRPTRPLGAAARQLSARPTALCDSLRLKPLPKTLEDIELSFPYVGVQPVDYAHLDAMCHVNNATYLQYFETARTRSLVELLGIEVTFEAKGKAPVLQDTWVSYRRPTFLFDTLRVALRAEDLAPEHGFMVHRYLIWSTKQSTVVAEGGASIVLCDFSDGGRRCAFDDEWAGHAKALSAPEGACV